MLKKISLLLITALSLFVFVSCRPSESKKEDSNSPIVIKIGHTDSSSRSTNTWSVS